MPHQFDGEFPIIVSAVAAGVINCNRLQMEGRFSQTDIFPDDRGVNLSFETAPELRKHFCRVFCPVIYPASQDPCNFKVGIQPLFH